MNYNKDIVKHINLVRHLIITFFIKKLLQRSKIHDASKLKSPEKEMFENLPNKLKNIEFGSEKYEKIIKAPANIHYKNNSHHPQYYENGINGMNLIDICEMICDWKAACERDNNNIIQSIIINCNRFNIDNQLKQILLNTVKEMGWD